MSAATQKSNPRMSSESILRVGLPNIEYRNDPASIIITNDYFLIRNLVITPLYLSSNSEFFSCLAKKWHFSEDGKSLTFVLREGVRFSNGDEITATDVSFTLKRLIILGSSMLDIKGIIVGAKNMTSMDQEVSGIQVTGRYEITLQFTRPYRRIQYFFARPESGIIHRTNIDPKTLTVTNWKISSGPYYGIKEDNTYTLHRNPNFPENFVGSGKMFETIQVIGIPKLKDGYARIKSGDIDILNYGAVFDPMFQDLETHPSLTTKSDQFTAVCYFQFNPKSSWANEKKNRNALYERLTPDDWRPYKSQIFENADQFFSRDYPYTISSNRRSELRTKWKNKSNILPKTPIRIQYADFFGEQYLETIKSVFRRLRIPITVDVINAKEWDAAYKRDDWDLMFTMQEMFPLHTEYTMHFLINGGGLDLFDPNHRISGLLNKITDDTVEPLLKKMSEIIYDESTVIPLFYSKWSVHINNRVHFDGFNDYEIDFQLWKVRKST